MPDADERNYRLMVYSKELINGININQNDGQNKISEQQKMAVIQLAIEKTYDKYKQKYGDLVAKKQVKGAIKQYIINGNSNAFTRQGNAREQIEKFVIPKDMLNLIAKSYVEQSFDSPNETILRNSVNHTIMSYGTEHTTRELINYITSGKIDGFTRTNNVRYNLGSFITPESAMQLVIDEFVEQNIRGIEKSNLKSTEIIEKAKTTYFYGDEFAMVQLPKEKRQAIITKAIQWIREKMRGKHKMKNKQNEDKEEKNIYKDNENQR